MDHIKVTENANRIIILRYYRERQPEGKYNVIHVYYRRDETGDHWEGTSGVLPQKGELGVKYIGEDVGRVDSFQPAGEKQAYKYTWDGRPQYGVVEESDAQGGYNPDDENGEFAGDSLIYRPNNAWKAATGTQEGNQIIILRYYREPGKEGQYNIIHEYYVREASGSQDSGISGDGEEDESEDERGTEEVGGAENRGGIQPLNGDLETDGFKEDSSGAFGGTLNRSHNDGYVYTFEGNTSMETIIAPLGSTHTAQRDDWELTYQGKEYAYIDASYGTKAGDGSYSCNPNQQWVASTKQGEETIILRYYRELEKPEESENPTAPGDAPDDSDPSEEEPGASGRSVTGTVITVGAPLTGDNRHLDFGIFLCGSSAVCLCALCHEVRRGKKKEE